eukprot:TRINITY_DN1449_c0_g1_i2.p1 TRINITY_DN1449_c0_g1~~TRINITY_DN1449_c0_g1_i2.p1  ORF type:complete len:280 (+),score=26.07 TRINITY_DN1449_c0_g1_i2:49-888(+)
MSENNNTCSYRWTGENCTIDNYSKTPLVIVIGIYQGVYMFLFAAMAVYGIYSVIRKALSEKLQWYTLSFFCVYMCVIGSLFRVLYFLDPFYYFDDVPLILNRFVFWFGSISIASASILTYAIWIEVLLSVKQIRRNSTRTTNFRTARIAFIVASLSLFFLFFVFILVFVILMGNLEAFNLVITVTSVLYTLMYLIVHLIFSPQLKEIIEQSVSNKILTINEYVNLMVILCNILLLVFGIVIIIFYRIVPPENEIYLPIYTFLVCFCFFNLRMLVSEVLI